MCVYVCVCMLKGVHVHVNAVSSINMYGNAWGEVVNKTWGQVTVALLYSLWMLISQATLLSGCDCGDLTISCSNVTAIGGLRWSDMHGVSRKEFH